jgi:hypothetical protein
MLGDINIKLPESTPRGFWWVALTVVATIASVALFPEVRHYVAHTVYRMTSTPTDKSGLPFGCVAVKMTAPLSISEVRFTFWRMTAEDVHACNPRDVRREGKSDVIDIASSPIIDQGARVTLRLRDGEAHIGLKDRTSGGYVAAVRCKPLTVLEAEWGSFVPDVLRFSDNTNAVSPQRRERLLRQCLSNDF